jgi:hypothetical protein
MGDIDWGNLLQGLFGVGATTTLMNDGIQGVEDSGSDALAALNANAEQVMSDTAFTPYSVTSGSGQVDAQGADGAFTGLNMQLTPELQAMVAAQRAASGNQLGNANQNTFDMTQGMLSQLGLGGAGRSEQDIFNMLNQVQQPQQERERLALEERLFNQGRSGVRTAQYGGTPEELAIAKAREEARSGMSVDAFNLARQDEERRFDQFSNMFGANMQDRELSGNMASNLFRDSFMAGDDLRRSGTAALDAASVDRQFRGEGIRTAAGLRESGAEANINAQSIANQGRIMRNQEIVKLLLDQKDDDNGVTSGLFSTATDAFGEATGWW